MSVLIHFRGCTHESNMSYEIGRNYDVLERSVPTYITLIGKNIFDGLKIMIT